MAKKQGHTTIRNQKLFCTHCGGEQVMPYPISVSMYTAMAKAFDKEHKKCPPSWKEPQADPSWSIDQRMAFWLNYGERGISSETIFQTISGAPILKGSRPGHPHDPDDFRRCYLLLKMIPEWKSELHKLKPLSDAWHKLVDNWEKLTELLEAAMKTEGGSAAEMYEFMESLGC